jgi:putative transposase
VESQQRIEDKAQETGILVEYVHPEYTSQICHACQHVGPRNGDEFRCQNDECWVSEYHTDINAAARLRLAGSQKSRFLATAVNIGDRHDPWSESLPLKPAGDGISRDGSAELITADDALGLSVHLVETLCQHRVTA